MVVGRGGNNQNNNNMDDTFEMLLQAFTASQQNQTKAKIQFHTQLLEAFNNARQRLQNQQPQQVVLARETDPKR